MNTVDINVMDSFFTTFDRGVCNDNASFFYKGKCLYGGCLVNVWFGSLIQVCVKGAAATPIPIQTREKIPIARTTTFQRLKESHIALLSIQYLAVPAPV